MYQNDYPYTAPVPQPVQNYSLQETAARNLQYIKDFCRKPQVLILAILFSASFVMTIVSSLVAADTMSRELAALFDIRRYSEYQTFYNTYIGTLITSAIVSALVMAALWIIHLRSRSNDPSASPLAGFTIIRVLAIIELVLISIVGLILFIALCILGSVPDETGYAPVFLSIAIPVIIIAVGLLILYAVSQIVFMGSFKKSLYSPFLLAKGSILFGVMMILFALASLSTLTNSTSSMYIQMEGAYYSSNMASNSSIVIISNLLGIAFSICAAVCAFSYYGYVKKVNLQIQSGYPQSSVPPYMGDPSQAAPYQGYTNPYYPQQGYYPYQQQTDYTNPYQQPQTPAQDYNNPYQQPQTPAQDYNNPYQQPQTPAQDYNNPYQQPQTPVQDYTNPYQQPQAPAADYNTPYEQPQSSEQDNAAPYQQPFAPLPYQQPSQPAAAPQDMEAPSVSETQEPTQPQAPVEEAAPQDTVADTDRRTCPVCGEQAGPGVEECPRCGMKL